MASKNYPIDRTYFKASTIEEADENYTYWKHKSLKERLQAAYYLITSAYNFSPECPHSIDRSYFTIRKLKGRFKELNDIDQLTKEE